MESLTALPAQSPSWPRPASWSRRSTETCSGPTNWATLVNPSGSRSRSRRRRNRKSPSRSQTEIRLQPTQGLTVANRIKPLWAKITYIYDSGGVNYDRRGFIRLAVVVLSRILASTWWYWPRILDITLIRYSANGFYEWILGITLKTLLMFVYK